jgi:hypothetical protein
MRDLTRREAAALGAAASAAAQVPAAGPAITRRHDEQVERLLKRQVTDEASPWCGACPDEALLYQPHSAAAVLEAFTAAFLHPESKFHRSRLLVARMQLAGRHLLRRQNEYGNVDLLTTNFNSPPDTAFVAHSAATAACLARRHGLREVLALAGPFLEKAGGALAVGGIHTPNHRWVVCQALAQIHELFPEDRHLRRIEQWLAEGIDIDADGQYAERSTLVYNIVTNRALVVLAKKLKRPDLLDPARRNLESMLYLLHPGYEVVTEVSRRQDVNRRGTIAGYWFALQSLALEDNDGRFASLAARFAPQAASLPALLEYPELARPLPPPAAIPEDYEKQFPALGIARIRRGAVSATLILGGSSRFFSLRRGEAVINAVRFASAFFGKGQFVPRSAARSGGAYHFTQSLTADYSQPLEPPRRLTGEEFYATRGRRRRSEICALEQEATVTESRGGFRVRVRARGTDNVPVAVEINLREGGTLEGCSPLAAAPDTWLLESGSAVYRAGRDAIRFGPGAAATRYVAVRGAEQKLAGPSVYLTGYTPFDHTLAFEWV